MWKLSINSVSKNNMIKGLDLHIPCQQRQVATRVNVSNNLCTLPYKHQQLKYMHQSFFSPPSQTLVEAANNNQLQGIPYLHSSKQVNKYLAPLPATSKERLKKTNVRTTRKKNNITNPPLSQIMENIRIEEIVDKINAPPSTDTGPNIIEDTEKVCDVFYCAALGNATTRVSYTGMTGAFPVISLENMQAYIVAYDHDTNNMFALPVPNFKDETLITDFEEIFNELKTRDTCQPSTLPTIKQQCQSKLSLKIKTANGNL